MQNTNDIYLISVAISALRRSLDNLINIADDSMNIIDNLNEQHDTKNAILYLNQLKDLHSPDIMENKDFEEYVRDPFGLRKAVGK